MTGNQVKTELLKKNKKLFLFAVSLVPFLVLAVWGAFEFILDPEYQASSQLLIEESAPANLHRDVEYNRVDSQAIEAYASFATSPEILGEVKEKLDLHNSIANLHQKIKVEYATNSPVLTITVASRDKQQAAIIANTLSSVFQNEVKNSLKAGHISIISHASSENIDASPSQQKQILSLSIAAVLGLISSFLITFIVRAKKNFAKLINRDTRKKENQMQTVFK